MMRISGSEVTVNSGHPDAHRARLPSRGKIDARERGSITIEIQPRNQFTP
jgi:hypothetical protein